MNLITCPEFSNLDREIIGDFNNCLQENIEEIEYCVNKLDESEDPDLVHELFRAMHSFKGNCRMVLLNPFVALTHELEEIVSEMRDGKRHYHHSYGSIFISVITAVDTMIKQLAEKEGCSGDLLEKLNQQVLKAKSAVPDDAGSDIDVIEEVVTALLDIQGFEQDETTDEESDAARESVSDSTTTPAISQQQQKNLSFFKGLADQVDGLSIYRQGRTDEVLRLCLEMNKTIAHPICIKQLTAAVYLHDMGMAFIPSSILNKSEKLGPEELTRIRQHVSTGSQLLSSIPGWQEASEIVAQHHERYDGSGYPKGLKENQIHPGAVLVALADTYCAVTNERSDRSYKKSLFSAVTLINGEVGRQFNPEFVELFNDTVRRLFITQK